MDNFDEYLRQGEPNKAEKAKVWKTAIGLQQAPALIANCMRNIIEYFFNFVERKT